MQNAMLTLTDHPYDTVTYIQGEEVLAASALVVAVAHCSRTVC